MNEGAKYNRVHLKDGRDAEPRIIKAYADHHLAISTEVFNAGRVGRVAYMINVLSGKRVIGAHDYKGHLTLVWLGRPDMSDLLLAEKVWASEFECVIAHIYLDKVANKYHPVEVDIGNTIPPSDVEGVLFDLLFVLYL